MDTKQQAIVSYIATSGHTQNATAKLEAYILQSCNGEAPYCFEAVRSLVKLYLLYPAKSSTQHLAYACLLVLFNDKTNDELLALKYMMSSQSAQEEPIKTALQAYGHLVACQFLDFWKSMGDLQANSDKIIQQMTKKSASFMQERILAIFALTYKAAPSKLILTAIQSDTLPKQDFAKLEGDSVVFATTAENSKSKQVFKQGLNFESVHSLMSKLAQ